MALQNAIFKDAKGGILQGKRLPFGARKVTFCGGVDYQAVTEL